jgi:hypothetical protein
MDFLGVFFQTKIPKLLAISRENCGRSLGIELSFSSAYHPQMDGKTKVVNQILGDLLSVGRLVVVIDVNPSHGFWTTRLMKLFGHEGKCTCRYNTHGWIVYIMLFPVVCGTSRGSSWLRRNEFLKMTK